MPALRFALDEDVSHALAGLLRSHGEDAGSAKELGRLGLSDVQVLLRAAEAGQTLVTHNSRDFQALHEAWVTWGRRWANEVEKLTGSPIALSQHEGILITPHMQEHELARIFEEFENSAGWMKDRLFVWNPARLWHELLF